MQRLSPYAALGALLTMGACSESQPSAEAVRQTSQALKDASATERADVVAVLSRVQGTDNWCTGVVLEPRLIMTAAHCLAPASAPNASVSCATATLSPISSSSQAWVAAGNDVRGSNQAFISVQKVRIPAGASRLCGDDIALLELAEPLSGATNATLTPEVPSAGSLFKTIGYGTDGLTSGIQRETEGATLVCVGAACADTRIAESELLAHSGACEGDSGGPALDRDGSVFAMAVRSRADCEETSYLQLAAYFNWLSQNARDVASTDGLPAPAWAVTTNPNTTPDASPTPMSAPQLYGYGGGCTVTRCPSRSASIATLLLAMLIAITCTRRKTP